MRCGRNVGMRVPMRKNSTCGIARNRPKRFSSLSSLNSSGSPPLNSTSRISGMLRDVGDLLVEFGMKIVAAGVADEPRARAVTAIRGAAVGDEEQHAVGIAMHEAGHGRMRIFAARVAHFPRRGVRFLDARNDLPADGAMLIRRVNQVEKIRRDGQRELVVRQFRAGEFLRRERGHQPLQLLRRGDAVFELPAPVVPVGIGNIVPEAAAGGVEFLQRLESVVRWRLPAIRRELSSFIFSMETISWNCALSS
jgi:hypothetical protein